MTTLAKERALLAMVANKVARICVAAQVQFVGSVGVVVDDEELAIVAIQVTTSPAVASLLASRLVPMVEASLEDAVEASQLPVRAGDN